MERARVTLHFDPGIRLPGQTGYLYLNRVSQDTLFRLGRGRIRGSAGHAVLSVSFSPPSHVSRQDRILWCVHRMTNLGLGAPGPIDSRCAAAQISLR
jgi:hypothetical protein